MGNRAVITTEEKRIGVYLHWNGGRDSVEGFLTYCKEQEFRPPEQDCYGWAALVTVISNFFGGTGMSVGIDILERLDCDNYDNGMYIIKNWKIIGREFHNRSEQKEYALKDMLQAIKESQATGKRNE